MGAEDDATNDVLSISSRRDGSAVVIALAGELDLHGAGQLDAELRGLLAGPVTSIEIDAARLDFVDSSGLRSVLQARSEAEAAGASFRIASVSPAVSRVIEIAGLADLLLPANPNPA
jgi:anti-sigma B factor antagonist